MQPLNLSPFCFSEQSTRSRLPRSPLTFHSFVWCITLFHMYVFIFFLFIIIYTYMCVKYIIVDSAFENHLWCFPLNYSVQIFFCFFKLSLGDWYASLSCIRAFTVCSTSDKSTKP